MVCCLGLFRLIIVILVVEEKVEFSVEVVEVIMIKFIINMVFMFNSLFIFMVVCLFRFCVCV